MKFKKRGQKAAGKNLFNSVKVTAPGRNLFDMTHDFKFSANMGRLVPIMNMPVVPGDNVRIKPSALIRLAPMLAPMMHRCDVSMHYFYVPNRILWENFENFINNGTSGTDGSQSVPAFPYVTLTESNYTPLCDYLGVPPPAGETSIEISALPFAAYQMIYNNYYRDQNLIDEVIESLVDGDNTPAFSGGTLENMNRLRNRAWEHDYLTSCLPFAQKGPAVELPIAGFGDVEVKYNSVTGPTALDGTPDDINVVNQPGATSPVGRLYVPGADLIPQAATINDLRAAEKLQQFLEKLARAGSRFVELIKGVFNVDTGDARVQIPEFIGGLKTPIQISEVLNMTGTDQAPQGNMAGHGVSVAGGETMSYFCPEHGYIIGIMSVMPRTAYQDGLHRDWTKFDPLDFYWPDFAHLGEQAVYNHEAFMNSAEPYGTFGYIPRYSEYRYLNSRVAGEFRNSLDFWHMGRKFGTAPALNQDFVEADPTHRVFAVTDEEVQKLYVQVVNGVYASRLMPVYGTPNL